MSDFSRDLKAELQSRGMSLRGLSKELHYNVSFLSRVMNDKQKPSMELAQALDAYLGTDFVSLLEPVRQEPAPQDDYVARSVGYFLEHDNRHGGDHVASAAQQVWKTEQSKLEAFTDKKRISGVAEIAEVAGWLLFDANRQKEAREAFIESHLLAKLAGDNPMQWFALDMLAMQDVQDGKAGEALRISEELLTRPKIPARVALLARVRHARALAITGDRSRTLDTMQRAQGALQDSIGPRDPQWAWWVDEMEVVGHQGEVFLSLGSPKEAIPHLQKANEMVKPLSRGSLYYSVAELTALVKVQAWREAEDSVTRIAAILDAVTSSRSRARMKEPLRVIDRDGPSWLSDYVKEVIPR
ncbi:helix-turn-helix domain-containing protein [Streptomyces sp. NPDC059513]|uniref:helix-turn-helix domain-containing protein n=1 Tax=unclassified Streptomyces TaxID=2593676 RepID=UPI00369B7046